MDITYLGHSSFRINSRDLSIVIDPFNPDSVGFKFPKVSADIVTVSHDHDDHNFVEGVDGYEHIFKGPGEYEVKGVSFIGFGSFHDANAGKERGKNTIFVIEFENFRICHLGDLGHKLSESQLNDIGEIDILMVPVGGVYTIGPQEATEVVRGIEPKVIIPMHYKTKEHNPKVFSELSELTEFTSTVSLKTVEETKLNYKKGTTLPDDQQLIILSKK